MNLFAWIEKLINEHGSATILGQRLLLLKEESGKVEKERADLYEKCAQLEKELAELRQKLAQASVPPEFVEHLGVLFKRDFTGRYAPTAYCPECKRPLWNTEPALFPYQCSSPGCNFLIDIHENLQTIAARLNEAGP